ncbi:F-box/kelch-repeat protein At3g23880-like [Lycium ferocissimum]|uniref:F-box/kelch-repeat protein At3g23880-like n=1 Tax=Lycium ferocissimum TaxID=112874 RepID=UPI002814C9ED|nr:F-box/kelch-repeat protein At3g23880-like [Lycium ferocissimum]
MNLPVDILVEILSRVPAKSLHRFRCVSKWFNCLICDHQFQNKHLGHAKSCTRDLESKRLITRVDGLALSFSLSSTYNNAFTWRPNYVSDNKRKSSTFMLVNCPSVNGLLCVKLGTFDKLAVHLWNPTTNELRRLPNSSLFLGEETYDPCDEPIYGLGHDSANDDYVVVRMIMRSPNSMVIKFEVYSLKNDSWRLIQLQPFSYASFRQDEYFNCQSLNSRFHWMVLDDNRDDISYVIVSLNLSNDEYKEIPQPNYQKFSIVDVDYTDVVVLDGQLCVYIHYFGRSFDLWTMKDYGVQQSWMMMLSIPQHDILASLNLDTSWLGHVQFLPFYLFENGDFLLKVHTGERKDIMVYKKDKKVLEASILGHETIGRSYVYTETLISPNQYLTPAPLRIVKNLNRVSRDRLIQYVS